jgi:hypothetical protein
LYPPACAVTEAHFQRAAKSDAASAKSALQNPVQQEAAANGMISQEQQKTPEIPGFLQAHAVACETVLPFLVPPRGLEPLSSP